MTGKILKKKWKQKGIRGTGRKVVVRREQDKGKIEGRDGEIREVHVREERKCEWVQSETAESRRPRTCALILDADTKY